MGFGASGVGQHTLGGTVQRVPYVRCERCGISGYVAVPWAQRATCPNCGSPLNDRSVEMRVRDLLYRRSTPVERVSPKDRPADAA